MTELIRTKAFSYTMTVMDGIGAWNEGGIKGQGKLGGRHEALNCDIDVPRTVQWKMLWYSAPTSLNNDLLKNGVIF